MFQNSKTPLSFCPFYLQEDTEDYHTVANYFEQQGYEIFAIVGHSRGMK